MERYNLRKRSELLRIEPISARAIFIIWAFFPTQLPNNYRKMGTTLNEGKKKLHKKSTKRCERKAWGKNKNCPYSLLCLARRDIARRICVFDFHFFSLFFISFCLPFVFFLFFLIFPLAEYANRYCTRTITDVLFLFY